ncbi:altronate dehydratase [Paenibacillus sp. HN-1]|uniref:UxaA family hydrolase n=1 Tax=Paenibacillus TaxID=44249 RepID=UPI001CA9733D|nr:MULTISPECIES: altronate dehydratase family protein [Paenibacillus]MBY9078332.1 altronate dehydratase [Paenibacillus sp. CGMCC 1.18879]MBY9086012.1 altronate dehydratase [Paenibacillus sinensis]
MNDWVRLSEKDHVVIALRPFSAGETITLENGVSLALKEDIPKSHKILTSPVDEGMDVLKFGYSIGKAKEELVPGIWVHTHNLRTGLGAKLCYDYNPQLASFAKAEPVGSPTFQGYIRPNGDVGIRNEIWIINTVGCINKTCEILARKGAEQFAGIVEGVYHFAHPYGCSQLGDDLEYTEKLLASLVNHPNAAGVLVIGLGCENNQLDSIRKAVGEVDSQKVRFMRTQDEADELEKGMLLLEELADYAATFEREPVSVNRLKIGLKCGGSDGLSGITANPLVGTIADRVTSFGGTAILTEVPEMFGAETILMNRAENVEVFGQIVSLINDFKEYFVRHNQVIYENPSPGNKAGGISTLEEKSLGCTQKGGHAIVSDVLLYGNHVSKPGLNLVQAPGNDLVSVTALAASGAHMVLFTTGRGTPFGGPVPTVKISSNSELAERKRNWIDFNAGQLLEGKSMLELTDELWEKLIVLASGDIRTLNETNGFKEIAIFKDGVIL